MNSRSHGHLLLLCFYVAGCGSDAATTPSGAGGTSGAGGALTTGGTAPTGTGGTSGGSPGTGGTPTASGGTSAGTGGHIATGGSTNGGAGGSTPTAGGASGTGGASGASGTGGAGGGGAGGTSTGGGGGMGGAGGASGGTALTGTLGALGAVQPTVAGWVVSNSGETLIYLSSAPLTCMQMQTQGTGWLPTVAAGSQVVEIVIKGAPTVKTYTVGPFQGEVNYAPGGMSSSHEVSATGGSITFTKAMANGPVEGTVMATYSMGSVMGTFHAEFCAMGSQY